MTEEEAKTKWCPFARAVYMDDIDSPAPAVNRRQHGAADHWCLCLASGCMVWRTYDDGNQGYCGLAQPTRAVP